jgi:ATP/maltotriose-dependent transcriptional regulator MalT
MTADGAMIGRDRELAELDGALARVAVGAPEIVVIAGEPGIGKTRLLLELSELARARAYGIGHGRATELEREAPFGPFAEALATPLTELADHRLAELAARLPELFAASSAAGGRSPAGEPPGLAQSGAGADRFSHHRALRALIEELAQRRPLVLIIDDIQWADPASVEATAYLLRHPPLAPVLVALAHRSASTPPMLTMVLDSVAREPYATRLTLEPLAAAEAALLLEDAPETARASIIQDSGGNPFYIEQLLRARRAERGGSSTASGVGEIEDAGSVPRVVVAAIAEELRQLPDEAQLMLGAAAVAGEPFDAELAAAVAELPAERALDLLDALAASELVRPEPGSPLFRFRHPLVRRAVYDWLPAGRRIRFHREAAAALARRGASAPAIARHVAVTARPGDSRAGELLAAAASEVLQVAPASAARWLTLAISLLPDRGGPQRLGLLAELAQAQAAAGSLREAHDTLLALLATAGEGGIAEPPRAVSDLASVCLALGRNVGVRERLERALAELPPGDAEHAVPLLLSAAMDAAYQGDFTRAEDAAQRALAAAAGSPLREAMAGAVRALMSQLQGGDRIAPAQRRAQAAAGKFDQVPDDELAGHLELPWLLGLAEFQLERWEDSVRHLQRGVDLALGSANGEFLPETYAFLAYNLLYLGRLDEAARFATSAIESSRLLDAAAHSTWALIVAGVVASPRDSRVALRLGGEALAMLGQFDESMVHDTTHGHFALICTDAGEHQQALEHMRLAGAPDFERFGDPARRCAWIEALTRSTVALGRIDEARAWADRAAELASGLGLPVAVAAATRAQALIQLEDGAAIPAAELVLAAAADCERAGARIEAARCRLLAGRALVVAGQRDAGVEQLQASRRELLDCGARQLAQHPSRELRRLGAPATATPREHPADPTPRLSERELEVAALVAQGQSNPQIARALYLSPRTVEGHLRRIFPKLGVASRSQVAAEFARTLAGESGAAAEPADTQR